MKPKRMYRTPYDEAVLIQVMVPEKVIVIEHYTRNGAKQYIWTIGKLRKDNRCTRCGQDLTKGAMAFRPMTMKDERPDRLCLGCLDDIVAGRWRDAHANCDPQHPCSSGCSAGAA
jgi:hypothetical protein